MNLKNYEEIDDLLKLVNLDNVGDKLAKNFSLGMKQRIGIALALLGNPKLLVLDEPINGLDADGMRIMREILTDIAKSGATVLISSHILGEHDFRCFMADGSDTEDTVRNVHYIHISVNAFHLHTSCALMLV